MSRGSASVSRDPIPRFKLIGLQPDSIITTSSRDVWAKTGAHVRYYPALSPSSESSPHAESEPDGSADSPDSDEEDEEEEQTEKSDKKSAKKKNKKKKSSSSMVTGHKHRQKKKKRKQTASSKSSSKQQQEPIPSAPADAGTQSMTHEATSHTASMRAPDDDDSEMESASSCGLHMSHQEQHEPQVGIFVHDEVEKQPPLPVYQFPTSMLSPDSLNDSHTDFFPYCRNAASGSQTPARCAASTPFHVHDYGAGTAAANAGLLQSQEALMSLGIQHLLQNWSGGKMRETPLHRMMYRPRFTPSIRVRKPKRKRQLLQLQREVKELQKLVAGSGVLPAATVTAGHKKESSSSVPKLPKAKNDSSGNAVKYGDLPAQKIADLCMSALAGSGDDLQAKKAIYEQQIRDLKNKHRLAIADLKRQDKLLVKELKKEAELRSQPSFSTSAPAEDTAPEPAPVRNQLLCTACNEQANWKCCSNAVYCSKACFIKDRERHGPSHEGASLWGDISYAEGDPVTDTTDEETIDEPPPQPAAVSVAPDAVSPEVDTEEDVIMLDDDEEPAPKSAAPVTEKISPIAATNETSSSVSPGSLKRKNLADMTDEEFEQYQANQEIIKQEQVDPEDEEASTTKRMAGPKSWKKVRTANKDKQTAIEVIDLEDDEEEALIELYDII